MALDELSRRLIEGDQLGGCDVGLSLLGASILTGINAVADQATDFVGLLTRLGQRHLRRGAKPVLAYLAADRPPDDPRLGAAVANLEVQAVAVAIQSGLARRRHSLGRQPVDAPACYFLRHMNLSALNSSRVPLGYLSEVSYGG